LRRHQPTRTRRTRRWLRSDYLGRSLWAPFFLLDTDRPPLPGSEARRHRLPLHTRSGACSSPAVRCELTHLCQKGCFASRRYPPRSADSYFEPRVIKAVALALVGHLLPPARLRLCRKSARYRTNQHPTVEPMRLMCISLRITATCRGNLCITLKMPSVFAFPASNALLRTCTSDCEISHRHKIPKLCTPRPICTF
jgi:hypothetical protein